MALEALTQRQAAVLGFIRENIGKQGYGPTVREIAEQFKISSPNGVTCHLSALAEKGYITRQKGLSRSIQLTEMAMGPTGLPLIAVEDTEIFDDPDYGYEVQYIDVAAIFDNAKGDLFLIQLDADGPSRSCVCKGDFLVMKKKRTAKKSQFVVVRDGTCDPILAIWTGESNTRGTKLLLPGPKKKMVVMKSPKILAGAAGMFRLL